MPEATKQGTATQFDGWAVLYRYDNRHYLSLGLRTEDDARKAAEFIRLNYGQVLLVIPAVHLLERCLTEPKQEA